MKKLLQDRKTLYLVLCIAVVSVFTLSIAYAAMSTVLEIHGNSEIVASSWDIYFANPVVKEGSAYGELPIPDIGFDKDVVYFSVELDKPGDFYEFSVDVVNDGTIDAMIDSVVITPELTSEQAKYIKYEITYQNGESINTKQTLKKGTATPIKLRIEYRKDISASDLPTTSTKLDFRMLFVYVQSDGTGSEIIDNGVYNPVRVVSGDGTQVGNEICIKNECFYVISSTDSSITMLSKYNLHVGNSVDEDWNVTPLASPTGIQDKTAKGYDWPNENSVKVFPFVGTTTFSNTDSTYSGSIVEGYVNSYNSYLITQGVTPIEVRLITKDELINLGCVVSDYCSSETPKWIYSTTYWTMTSWTKGEVYALWNDSVLNHMDETIDDIFGIRPVIVISKTLLNIAYNSSEVKELIEFTIDGVTYQAEEGMTWGEWIDSEYNSDGFTFNEYGFVSSDGWHLLSQCVESSNLISKNTSYTVNSGDMVCDSDDW